MYFTFLLLVYIYVCFVVVTLQYILLHFLIHTSLSEYTESFSDSMSRVARFIFISLMRASLSSARCSAARAAAASRVPVVSSSL